MLEYGWFEENSFGEVHPVAEKAPVTFDGHPFYDLRGNTTTWLKTNVGEYIQFLDDNQIPRTVDPAPVKKNYYIGGNDISTSMMDHRDIVWIVREKGPMDRSKTLGLRLVRRKQNQN